MGVYASKLWAKVGRKKTEATQPIEVCIEDLPADSSFTFPGHSVPLPSPADVRLRAEKDGAEFDTAHAFRPGPVRFPELGLIVKWGEDVTIAEGQCLWFIKRYLQKSVPVPRIFGWKQDAKQTFLYLELIEGDTLADRWTEMNEAEKSAVCKQLRGMIMSWRRIAKPSAAEFQLSQIGDQALRDIMFCDSQQYPAGPFPNVAAFHDFFAGLVRRAPPRREMEEMAGLADDVSVRFTHADLDQTNIMVSKAGQGPLRIVAIIDWHQSGWYPEHWEILKARTVGMPGSDWRDEYLSKVLEAPNFEYYYAWEYVSMATI